MAARSHAFPAYFASFLDFFENPQNQSVVHLWQRNLYKISVCASRWIDTVFLLDCLPSTARNTNRVFSPYLGRKKKGSHFSQCYLFVSEINDRNLNTGCKFLLPTHTNRYTTYTSAWIQDVQVLGNFYHFTFHLCTRSWPFTTSRLCFFWVLFVTFTNSLCFCSAFSSGCTRLWSSRSSCLLFD